MELKYSIIIQGLITNDNELNNILSFKKYSNDIIFSTWNNMLSKEHYNMLALNNIKILELKDPGSIKSYFERINKFLNVSRRLTGFRAALEVCKEEYVFITRVDCSFNFEIAFWQYFQSNRKFGVTNVSSVNPTNILSAEIYFCICDWLYIGKKSDFLDRFSLINESFLISDKKFKLGNQTWFSKLSAEQIFTLLLSNQKTLIYEISNENFNKNLNKLKIHSEVLKTFVNLDWELINLKSLKFNFFTQDWICYKDLFFNEKKINLIKRFRSLVIFLAAKIKSKL